MHSNNWILMNEIAKGHTNGSSQSDLGSWKNLSQSAIVRYELDIGAIEPTQSFIATMMQRVRAGLGTLNVLQAPKPGCDCCCPAKASR